MKLIHLIFNMVFVISCSSVMAQVKHEQPKRLEIDQFAPDFNLKGTDGEMYSLASFSEAKVLVVIFSTNHCPTAQAYEDRIISITNDYKDKGVQVVMISSSDPAAVRLPELAWTDLGDSYEDMIIRYKDMNYNFPYLYDGDDQKAALAYGPVATPHAFVFNADRKLKYTGRIDESEKPGTANGEDLRNAISMVLMDKNPDPTTTKVFGCSIKWSWKKEGKIKQLKKMAELPVSIDTISVLEVKELLKNKGDKLRMINVWATWCSPCTEEFPDLVIIDRMYRKRDFEFISISTDKLEKKERALKFLKENEASNKNYIYTGENIYPLIEAIDPEWQGALPYTLLVEPGGKVIYRIMGSIDPLTVKKQIVKHPLIGRYF